MDEESLKILIARLNELTDRDKLRWAAEPARDDEFSVVVGEHYYLLNTVDRDGFAPFRLQIHAKGKGILAPLLEVDSNDTSEELAGQMLKLYLGARAYALGLKNLTNTLLAELSQIDPPTSI